MNKMTRDEVEERRFLLRNEAVRTLLHKWLDTLPLDPVTPIEVLTREEPKKRKMSLNDAMWAGPLRDIEEQAWFRNMRFRAEVWHEHFKELFLPDENSPDFDPSHVLDGYHKWRINPWRDTRELAGSTTQLTNKGMRHYLMQMEAEAASEYGVTFTERNNPVGRCT